MAEKYKSFEEFYLNSKDDILDFDIVADYAKTHNGDIGEFYGNMFCPECKKAELSFVHKNSKRRAHLRRYKSSSHEDNCSYNYDYASHKVVKEYVDSLSSEEIQDRLNSIMNMLCGNKNHKKLASKDINDSLKDVQSPMLIKEKTINKNILRALRRKKLNSWIDESDGEDFCVFYGKVKLKIEEIEKLVDSTNSYKYYLLHIYTRNKKGEWKFRTRLYLGNIKKDVNEESIYDIVMIGHLDFKFKPFTIKLANKNAIKFREQK